MKPTLFLLAAGMGSRYGGLKQLDGLGPNGETIMDYSIYDAIQAGFGKIIWVIRKDFEEQFRTQILSKYEGKVQCELCFQALDALPAGFSVPEGRVKPWGTNHAVLMGKEVIKEPFCVINCDDFYGRDAFMQIGKFLSNLPEGAKNQYAMVGFRVCNTLSENGSVARGVCAYNDKRHLTDVVERTEILRIDGVISYKNLKAEFFIPLMVNKLITEGTATCEVLDTTSKWFGVTYAADRDATVARIQKLVDDGVYPNKLF